MMVSKLVLDGLERGLGNLQLLLPKQADGNVHLGQNEDLLPDGKNNACPDGCHKVQQDTFLQFAKQYLQDYHQVWPIF